MRRFSFNHRGGPWSGRADARAIVPALWLCACVPGQVLDMKTNAEQGAGPSSQAGSASVSIAGASAESQLTAAGHAAAAGAQGNAPLSPSSPRYEPAAGAPALAPQIEPAPGDAGSEPRLASPLGERVFGVTIDDVSPLYDITEALAGLAKKPTTRVIFDPLRAPTSYQATLRRLQGVSYVMGELLDSVAVADFTRDAYVTRASEYMEQLGDLVDIWEIGTEVNGEWLGSTPDVVGKLEGAFEQATLRGKRSALTLYYNEGCVQRPENALFTWTKANLSDAMKRGLDYVFVTYYEERCHRPEPDWRAVFKQLREIFPSAKLGIGGCGTSDETRKAELVQHYYTLQVDVPGYVGGYFWWYFRQDMQPLSKPLWNVLNQSLETLPL